MKGLNFGFLTRLKPYEEGTPPVFVRGFPIPQRFEVELLFNDQKPRSLKMFSVWVDVEFNNDEIPKALEIRTRGFTHQKQKGSVKPLSKSEPLQRWQLEAVESNLSEIVALAVSLSAQTIDFDETTAKHRQEILKEQKSGIKKDISGSINYDDLEMYRPWFFNAKGTDHEAIGDSWDIAPTEFKAISEDLIVESRRRKITSAHLKLVAQIYRDEMNRALNETSSGKRRPRPVEEIMVKFGVLERRTVDYWISSARERGFLEPVATPKNSSPKSKRGSNASTAKTKGKK